MAVASKSILAGLSVLLSTSLALAASETANPATTPYTEITPESPGSSGRWYEHSFEELLDMEIVTATRSSKRLSSTPSVMTVYTAKDIQRMGAKNIKELLERTAGFAFNQQIAGPMIGSRGYISDNEQFLLLIDGHNANSIVDKGPGYFFLFPMLDHVDRIEIVRGPGSTLWGSDAALGIVHIITKDGSDIQGNRLDVSLPMQGGMRYDEHGYQYQSFQTGERISDDVQYMMSFMHVRAGGFPEDGFTNFFSRGRYDQLDDSYEFYLKAQLRDTTIRGRTIDFKNSRPSSSLGTGYDQSAFSRRRHSYLDFERKRQVTDNFQMETRLFTDLMERWQELVNPNTTPDTTYVIESGSSKESAVGLEWLGRWQAIDRLHLLTGMRAVQTEVDPVTERVIYPLSSENSAIPTILDLRVVPEELDKNIAVFGEADWSLIPDALDMILGLRLDKNNLREDNTIALPRLALNWNIDDDFRLMYAYNTGYIRPPVGIGFLGQRHYNRSFDPDSWIYGAKKSERIFSNDLQLAYRQHPFSAALTLYSNTITDAFNFLLRGQDVDDERRVLYYINTNQIKTQGYEFEFSAQLPFSTELYGNYSHVISAKIGDTTGTEAGISYDLNTVDFRDLGSNFIAPDKTLAGYPHDTWNLGINYAFSENGVANLHYRGWDKVSFRQVDTDFATYVKSSTQHYGSESFVDLNIRLNDIGGKAVSGSIYVKNLLNNDEATNKQLLFLEEWVDQGRTYGATLSFQF